MIQYKSLKNECGIYCFKNLINNKCYIGQAINLRKRLRSHYTAFKTKTNLHLAFYKAVNKYGEENFDLEILEYVDPTLENLKEVLDELEKKYIQEYNSFGPNGYNMTLGGDAGVLGLKMTDEQKEKIRTAALKQAENTKVRIWCREISRPEYSYGLSYEEAAEKSGVCHRTIQQICLGTYSKPYAKGWTFAKDEITLFNNCACAFRAMAKGTYDNQNFGKFKKGHRPSNKVSREIIELDDENNIIAEFESIK
jgi:group I intron endonuclease